VSMEVGASAVKHFLHNMLTSTYTGAEISHEGAKIWTTDA
jgi:hypothetical protein